MDFGIAGKTAVVTGASSGIGRGIALALRFLASPLARYITGTVIPVDGGLRRYQF